MYGEITELIQAYFKPSHNHPRWFPFDYFFLRWRDYTVPCNSTTFSFYVTHNSAPSHTILFPIKHSPQQNSAVAICMMYLCIHYLHIKIPGRLSHSKEVINSDAKTGKLSPSDNVNTYTRQDKYIKEVTEFGFWREVFRIEFLHTSATQNRYAGVENSAISSSVQFLLGCHVVSSRAT